MEHFPYAWWYVWDKFLEAEYLEQDAYSFAVLKSIEIRVEQFTPPLKMNKFLFKLCH